MKFCIFSEAPKYAKTFPISQEPNIIYVSGVSLICPQYYKEALHWRITRPFSDRFQICHYVSVIREKIIRH